MVKMKGQAISEERILIFATQVLHALQILHAAGVIHRDIKPQNIVFMREDQKLIKVCDFGTSGVLPPNATYMTTS
jgi:serine/threonine protein kinase